MKWAEYVDADEVRKAISVLQKQGSVFEVRVIGTSKKDTISGYFRDADTAIEQFDRIDLRGRNVYVTLGELKEDLFARAQSEHFVRTDVTTSDPEVIAYRWLFIDLDPVRISGVSSTAAELHAAEALENKVLKYLSGLGFCEPVRAMSGNGYHLLYRIDVPNDPGNSARGLIEKCLKVLAALFNTAAVKIDTTNYNPSRICKLHGTLAQKGISTEERPHRMSRLLSVPDKLEITDRAVLLRLAAELPDEPKVEPKRYSRIRANNNEFDLVDFMQRNGMRYKEDSNNRAKIYRLEECPFNPAHKNGDAKIFQYDDGAIAFKCHHNSCSDYRWQDVRIKFEPDAYDYEDDSEAAEKINAGLARHFQLLDQEGVQTEAEGKKEKRQPRKLKTAEGLMLKEIPEPKVFIGIGNELPLLVEGTCILSAKPKLGKSWFALGMCLAVASGSDFLGYKTRQCSTLYLDLETSEALQQKRLRKAIGDKDIPKNFYLETETDTIDKGFCEQIESYLEEDENIGIVVIDVFQIIRTAAKSFKESEYEHAYRDLTPLNELALKYHISIILVCHDRKAVDPDDPFSNILGSTGLQGAATQMIVMYRRKKDDPIHLSVKGKTIDGIIDIDTKLDNAQWSIVDGCNSADVEKTRLLMEYHDSVIREAVLEIVKHTLVWKGQCSDLVGEVIQYGIAVTDSFKEVGRFLNQHQARFLAEDGIMIKIIKNGTGPRKYCIQRNNNFTIDTIDENEWSTIDETKIHSIFKGF